MKVCYCCHKKINGDVNYHPSCLRKLFGVPWVPEIQISSGDFPLEVRKKAGKMSISGVQMKASIKLDKTEKILSIVDEGGTHILKPEPQEYQELPQNENLCMNIAELSCIETPPHGLFPMSDGKLCYVTRRFDRIPGGGKLHVEDMAQILGLSPDSKYDSSLEKVGKAIVKDTTNKYLDVLDYFERILLCFLLGNGDMHLKNWSLLMSADNRTRIAPCYDLICSELYIPGDDESALTIRGKRSNLKREDFEYLAEYLSLDKKSASNSFKKFHENQDKMIGLIGNTPEFTQREKFIEIVDEKFKRLYG
jgi:serine/threonine-protein kinase HipA